VNRSCGISDTCTWEVHTGQQALRRETVYIQAVPNIRGRTVSTMEQSRTLCSPLLVLSVLRMEMRHSSFCPTARKHTDRLNTRVGSITQINTTGACAFCSCRRTGMQGLADEWSVMTASLVGCCRMEF